MDELTIEDVKMMLGDAQIVIYRLTKAVQKMREQLGSMQQKNESDETII